MSREIIRGNGEYMVKVSIGPLTTIHVASRGSHWTTSHISPELSRLTIEVLQEYLKNRPPRDKKGVLTCRKTT